MVSVRVNYAESEDYPLIKTKFDVYNCTYVSFEHWKRDLYLTRELNIDGLRYDPGWGWGEERRFNRPHEYGGEQIGGSAEKPVYNFKVLDEAAAELEKHQLKPMYVCAYTPAILQDERASWQGKPRDLEAFAAICEAFANHFRTTRRANYYEVWNEPDLTDVFFHDTMEDYLEIYNHVSRALRKGDPDALIGGPSLAYKDEWMPAFLAYIQEHGLPIDYISYHHYGDVRDKVAKMREELAKYPSLATVQTLMTEYNSFQNGKPIFSVGGKIETYEAAKPILKDFKWFLSQPDLNKVYWAQFSDPEVYFDKYVDRCGLITTDGHRKASFNAFKIYGDMPVNRKRLDSDNPAIDGMASSDAHKSAVVLWNDSETEQTVDLTFLGVPFGRGIFKLYRIDQQHASYLDCSESEHLEPVEIQQDVTVDGYVWHGVIPPQAVIYATLEDGSLLEEQPLVAAGREIQTLYYYPDRTKRNYAEFDRKRWTAYLGAAEHDDACSIVGVIAEDLEQVLRVSFDTEGAYRSIDNNSVAGLQLDYEVNGEYVKSVLFHGDLYDPARTSILPWGTTRLPDAAVQVRLDDFQLEPATYAPEGWDNGRCLISFILQHTGAGTRATVRLNPAEQRKKVCLIRQRFQEQIPLREGTLLPLDLTDGFTIAYWLNVSPEQGRNGGWDAGKAILTAAATSEDGLSAYGISLTGNRISFGVGASSIRSTLSVNDGKWRHIAATRCSETGKLRLYVNGRLEAEGSGNAGSTGDINGLIIGKYSLDKDAWSGGMIAGLTIYNYPLIQGEIDELSGVREEAARFDFAESVGDVILDRSIYGKNGTLYGGTARGRGEVGPFLSFNGLDSYAAVKRNVSDDFTIAFQLRTTDVGGTGEWYEGKGIIDSHHPDVRNAFGISLMEGKLAFGACNPAKTVVSEQRVNDGSWHHCAVTRRRSDGVMSIFIDGKLSAETAGGHTSLFSSYELSIGRIHTGVNYFEGQLGDLRMYHKALSAEQIALLANGKLE